MLSATGPFAPARFIRRHNEHRCLSSTQKGKQWTGGIAGVGEKGGGGRTKDFAHVFQLGMTS